MWCLWLQRNQVVFNVVSPHGDLKSDVLAKAAEYVYYGVNSRFSPTRSIIQIKWLHPPLNWVKLNSDGPSLGNPGQAGGGGLIRDSSGVWIRG